MVCPFTYFVYFNHHHLLLPLLFPPPPSPSSPPFPLPPPSPSSLLLCVWVGPHVSCSACVEVRGQLHGAGSLFHYMWVLCIKCRSPGLLSKHLTTEQSHRLLLFFFFVLKVHIENSWSEMLRTRRVSDFRHFQILEYLHIHNEISIFGTGHMSKHETHTCVIDTLYT